MYATMLSAILPEYLYDCMNGYKYSDPTFLLALRTSATLSADWPVMYVHRILNISLMAVIRAELYFLVTVRSCQLSV